MHISVLTYESYDFRCLGINVGTAIGDEILLFAIAGKDTSPVRALNLLTDRQALQHFVAGLYALVSIWLFLQYSCVACLNRASTL